MLFWPAFGNLARPGLDGARCIDNHIYVVASGVVDMACDVPAEAFTRAAITNPAGEATSQPTADDGLFVTELPLESGRLRPWPVDPNYLQRRMATTYAAIARP